jgi:hypothetical protein
VIKLIFKEDNISPIQAPVQFMHDLSFGSVKGGVKGNQ